MGRTTSRFPCRLQCGRSELLGRQVIRGKAIKHPVPWDRILISAEKKSGTAVPGSLTLLGMSASEVKMGDCGSESGGDHKAWGQDESWWLGVLRLLLRTVGWCAAITVSTALQGLRRPPAGSKDPGERCGPTTLGLVSRVCSTGSRCAPTSPNRVRQVPNSVPLPFSLALISIISCLDSVGEGKGGER